MVFLHPYALMIGAAALGLPVLVHWLTRPRPQRMPLSTLRFVREAVHQRRAIHRLRDYIILALRVAAVGLLAWAFARPLMSGSPLVSDAAETGSIARVVLVDVSQSMAASWRGVQAFERARSVAASYLDGRPGLQAGVIFAGAQPHRVFDGLSANFGDLRRELAQAQPRPERCNVQPALLAAADILTRAPGDKEHRRELVVVTDLQQANWSTADFSVLPADTVIQLESVAAEELPPNLAIVRVAADARTERGRPARIEVEVANSSVTPRDVTVELAVGTSVQRIEGVCPANGTVVLMRDLILPDTGWLHGEARLLGVQDALAVDNRRSFVVDVRPQPTYALVTREEADRRPSASYYLERALVPQQARETQGARVVRILPAHVNRESLASADMVVVVRPGRLTSDAASLLVGLMRRGRPVLYVASEGVDALNLDALAHAAGPDLHMPVRFAAPAPRESRHNLRLAQYRRDLPPFNVFGTQVVTAVEPLRFARGLDTREAAGGLKDDVLATYSDKNAGLVLTTCGSGALGVLNADLAESNLAQSAAFVPLLGELTSTLLEWHRSSPASECGQMMTAYLPADAGAAASLRLAGPSVDAGELGELVEEPAGVVWKWPSAGPPGVYEVRRDGKCVLAVATGIPREESDLRPLAAREVAERAAGSRTVHYRTASSQQQRERDDAWSWIAVGCVVLMLVELLVLRAFRT